jgi:type II secretory ATPase GspE/PulE/Tfp pilus assembly ATPase PilB-like protein
MCGEPYRPSQQEMDALGLTDEDISGLPIRKGFGCPTCRGTGYLGRTAIFEIMPISDGIKLLIHDNMAAHLIKRAAKKEGMHTLRDSAIAKFKTGLTTSEEVLRIIGGIDLETLGE